MAFLKVYTSEGERTVFLGDAPVVFGRGDTTDVLLKDVKVSREHCAIEPCGTGRWQIRDLGSGNGTKLNGKKVATAAVLEPDDVVQVGDAKVLFAAEAVAVVADTPEREPPAERPASRVRRPARTSPLRFAIPALVVVCGVVLYLVLTSRGSDPNAEDRAYASLVAATDPADRAQLGRAFLDRYPASARADEVADLVARARRERGGAAGDAGAAPVLTPELQRLRPADAVAQLEKMLAAAPMSRRPAVREALETMRTRLTDERETFFAGLERDFRAQVEAGQFARAREMWFFLRGDPEWEPVPPRYVERIVDNNRELENAAAAARTALFEKVQILEEAHEFRSARELLSEAGPRFAGTSVARSVQKRAEFVERALREGVSGPPKRPRPVVTVDVARELDQLLQLCARREFAGAAAGLRALADRHRGHKDHGALEARALECEAAAELQARLAAALAAGKLPRGQIAKRWRVRGGGADGLQVTSRGQELDYPWSEVPSALYLELAKRETPDGPPQLGFVVLAHAVAPDAEFVGVLGEAYGVDELRGALDAFVAARVRKEAPAPGGYVVDGGEILSRKEALRKREEALIAQLQAQLEKAHAAIVGSPSLKKLQKLTGKKDKLDEARAYALELIFDTRKYFYPYRGTGRMGEYNKVQQEVDARVAAVRDFWDDATTVKVKLGEEMRRDLKRFDEAAAELEKRLVDVAAKVDEVAFIRSYFGTKFTIRNLFRNFEEFELLRYSDEVMEFNVGVKGDILDPEREQVRVTNEYRKMFGRWPVRLVEPLVLSSRGHCEEMSRLGYFGHFSPTPGRVTPYDRMRLQKYLFGASENCHAGTSNPLGAHRGWTHSSGHHRNLLVPEWTEMGSGLYGRYWTQNFGRAPKYSKHDPKPEDRFRREWEEEEFEDEEGCGEEAPESEEYDYEDDQE